MLQGGIKGVRHYCAAGLDLPTLILLILHHPPLVRRSCHGKPPFLNHMCIWLVSCLRNIWLPPFPHNGGKIMPKKLYYLHSSLPAPKHPVFPASSPGLMFKSGIKGVRFHHRHGRDTFAPLSCFTRNISDSWRLSSGCSQQRRSSSSDRGAFSEFCVVTFSSIFSRSFHILNRFQQWRSFWRGKTFSLPCLENQLPKFAQAFTQNNPPLVQHAKIFHSQLPCVENKKVLTTFRAPAPCPSPSYDVTTIAFV